MLEKTDQRGKVAILLMCSSGMRVGASLKIRNLEKIDRYGIYKITVYENEDEEFRSDCRNPLRIPEYFHNQDMNVTVLEILSFTMVRFRYFSWTLS
jgi:hypothetical protein